jgi:hypothetical protein
VTIRIDRRIIVSLYRPGFVASWSAIEVDVMPSDAEMPEDRAILKNCTSRPPSANDRAT